VIASAFVANVPWWRLYVLLRLDIHRVRKGVRIGRVVPRRKGSDKDSAYKEGATDAAPVVESVVVKTSSMRVSTCVNRRSKRQRTHEHETDDLFHTATPLAFAARQAARRQPPTVG
jgi:hypothetical protein